LLYSYSQRMANKQELYETNLARIKLQIAELKMLVEVQNAQHHSGNMFVKWNIPIKCPNSCHCTNALTWYSYRYKRYYCNGCHKTGFDESNMMMSFQTQEHFREHVKHCHDVEMDEFDIPELSDYQLEILSNMPPHPQPGK